MLALPDIERGDDQERIPAASSESRFGGLPKRPDHRAKLGGFLETRLGRPSEIHNAALCRIGSSKTRVGTGFQPLDRDGAIPSG